MLDGIDPTHLATLSTSLRRIAANGAHARTITHSSTTPAREETARS
jgi:hypothetical protein